MATRKRTAPTHPTPPTDETENTPVSDTTEATPVKRTRQADPLLAAKRDLEAAQKRVEKAQTKWDKVSDVETELKAATEQLTAARTVFQSLVAKYIEV